MGQFERGNGKDTVEVEVPYRDLKVIIKNPPSHGCPELWNVDRLVARKLVEKRSRLTGAEVAFLKRISGLSGPEFAERLHITHQAVMKWELRRTGVSRMSWVTEKDIRLFTLSRLCVSSQEFLEAYRAFEKPFGLTSEIEPLFIDMKSYSEGQRHVPPT